MSDKTTNNNTSSFQKYLPVIIRETTILGLVDSGNGITNAMSKDLAKRLGFEKLKKHTGVEIGTAKQGQKLNILGTLEKVPFYLVDSDKRKHLFKAPIGRIVLWIKFIWTMVASIEIRPVTFRRMLKER